MYNNNKKMLAVTKNMTLISIVLLASACLTTVNAAACIERPLDNNSTSDSAVDKVSNFFVEVGCTIKSGAERVKERVESSYNYLKSKITPEDMKNQTLADGQTTPADDRITFKEDEQPDNMAAGIGGSVQATTPAGVHKMPEKFQVVDRTALIAPEMCAEGQVYINGKCRLDADL